LRRDIHIKSGKPLTVPIKPGSAELSEKKSTFLAEVHLWDDPDAVKALVQELRAKHFKARHVAWAFVIGSRDNLNLRYSDDGEPSGTAGRPILGLLQKRDHTNTLVTVVRYFGGVKLGAGGLVRAYSGAAKLALDATTWEPLLSRVRLRLTTSYERWPVVEPALQQAGVTEIAALFADDVTVTGRIVESAFAALRQHLTNLCRGDISVTVSDEQDGTTMSAIHSEQSP